MSLEDNPFSDYEIDQKIRTAANLMKAMPPVTVLKDTDLVTKKILSREIMSPDSKYHYCPFCLKRIKRAGLDYKTELKPLWVVTEKCLYAFDNGIGRIIYEKHKECSVCKDFYGNPKVITEEDIISAWARPLGYTPEKKVVNLDMDSIRKAGFENFGL